jgi:two-component system CheB/CheR fusion protein
VITFVEITERRHMEQALRESERQLHQQKRLIDLARVPIFVWEPGGSILEWNRGCEELYGYAPEEAIGKHKKELLKTEVPGSSFEEVTNKLREEGIWSGEFLHRTKDGRVLTVEAVMQVETVGGRQLALQSVRDITDRKSWEERQRMLLRDQAHRLKNTLAVVQSIARQTMRGHPAAQDFGARFDSRVEALASAHTLLSQSRWESVDLAELVRKLLAPYAAEGSHRYRLEGERVELSAELATPFGLVLHELATNAAKYGSLSRIGGTILIKWASKSEGGQRTLEFIWEEHGGPLVEEPAKRSLGSVLIEGAIPNATVRREFHADGLVCTIQVAL